MSTKSYNKTRRHFKSTISFDKIMKGNRAHQTKPTAFVLVDNWNEINAWDF